MRPVRPAPFVPGTVRRRFVRGRERPRGVAWFGFRSFWGHLQHFLASAIAAEDVDSRDWMTPDEPRALMERVSRLLGAAGPGVTVTERLGRELWIDYLADTGDDVAVSRAVAHLVFTEYELPDPARPGQLLRAPRGDILFFGGDTAYPVATADEIKTRVVAPFNQVLSTRDDGKRRVLLGIPGNHDWYDGLDGFGRLFRRHTDFDSEAQSRPTLSGATRTLLSHYGEWAREFVRGGHVDKPATLDLLGYTAVQSASYFALPLAPGLPLLAVDRQLTHVDSRQRHFFSRYLNQNLTVSPWVMLPDPVFAFGEPSLTGVDTITKLGLTLTARPHLVVAGDIHHYRREREGPTVHVTAGGGGAFLHPAPVAGRPRRAAMVEWPERAQSRALLWQVPWKVALGRSGLLPHALLTLVLAPVVAFAEIPPWSWLAAGASGVALCAVLALLSGLKRGRARVIALAAVIATVILSGALLLREAALGVLTWVELRAGWGWLAPVAELGFGVLLGAFCFGLYLALLTRFGLENTQAFTALDHPGYKHFVRFRVRADGSAVDGFVLGLVDPVRPGELPVLVDVFSWSTRF